MITRMVASSGATFAMDFVLRALYTVSYPRKEYFFLAGNYWKATIPKQVSSLAVPTFSAQNTPQQ